MKRRKMVVGSVLILAMATSLIGCGGANGSGSSSDETASADKPYAGQELVVVSWGGAMQDAQREAIFEPFEKEYGITITEVSPTDYGTVTAQAENGNIEYDVVNAQPDYAMRMEAKGYLEPIDYSVVDATDFDKDWYGDYWLASDLYATGIVYNTDDYPDEHPSSWAEVWDTDKFKGTRTFWDYPTGILEAALLADGVSADEIYPIDVDRAFASLDKIKSSVKKWWDTGAESIQLIANGEASVGALWASRVSEAKAEGQPVELETNESIVGADSWIVLKGAKQTKLAMEFINFATRPEQMASMMKLYPVGSLNTAAYDLLDQETLDGLATNPDKKDSQIMMNDQWWVDNGDAVVERMNSWLLE